MEPASRHVGRIVIESMKLANLWYLCSRIVFASRFVFTQHKCLMLAFLLASLVKTKLNFTPYAHNCTFIKIDLAKPKSGPPGSCCSNPY